MNRPHSAASEGIKMKLLDLLRKLGILRFGTKTATYTSGKDRPIEFMADNVLNAEKDLISGGKKETPSKSSTPPGDKT